MPKGNASPLPPSRHATQRATPLLVALAIAIAACGGRDAPPPPPRTPEQAAVAASDSAARAAAALPATGRWDEPHLVERLVRSGLAPQRVDTMVPAPWMGDSARTWRLGRALLHAWVYPDSLVRARTVGALDSLTVAPPGTPSPFGAPRELIVQGNLAAVLVGANPIGSERVRLVIEAGLPVSP